MQLRKFQTFSSAGMDGSFDWRFKTHLANLPIYIGVGDEANQGLCTGTENYWCVTFEKGTTAMANDMGFVIPFKNAVESPNLFVKHNVFE